jgi:hypothetical protein
MNNVQSSGIDPGQRRLNGPQTTGRDYRNLSQPTYTVLHNDGGCSENNRSTGGSAADILQWKIAKRTPVATMARIRSYSTIRADGAR